LRGLTKTLSSLFYPEFSLTTVLEQCPKKKPKKNGLRVGNLVDHELRFLVGARDNFKVVANPAWHPRTHLIHRFLDSKGWSAISTQCDLGCECLRLGTRVDLVCVNGEGQAVLVEIKNGFDNYIDVDGQGCMLFPFDKVPQTVRNQHLLQLMFTKWLFEHCAHEHSDLVLAECVVVRIFENQEGNLRAEAYVQPDWVVNAEVKVEAVRMLKNSRFQTKRKRQRLKAAGRARAKRRRDKQVVKKN
jgi:hypothetical protein